MLKSLISLSKHTLTYGFGNVISRMIPFLLLPALTNILPPDQFGIQQLYYILIAVGMEIVRLGLDIALLRFYIPEKTPEKRQVVFSSIFWTALLITGILSIALWLGAEFWTKLIIDSSSQSLSSYPSWMFQTLKICALIILFDNLYAFPLTVMRAENKSRSFMLIRLTGVTLQTVLTLWFLIGLERGIQGIFEANLIASVTTFILTIPTIVRKLRFTFKLDVLFACLAFGLPNVPNVLFVQIIELSDRKILEIFSTPTQMGIYSAGYKLGMFLAIAAMGFRLAWQPFFMQIKDEADAKRVFGRILSYYLMIACWVFLVLTAFIEPLATFKIPGIGRSFLAPEYWSGIAVFPVISLAHIFNGIYAVIVSGMYIKKKMHHLPWITGIAAIVNLGGNLLLVPIYGMWASAWLTVISYAIMAGLLFIVVQRFYPIPYQWVRILKLSALTAVLFAIGYVCRLNDSALPGYLLSLTFPIFLWFSNIIEKKEKSVVYSLLKK